MTKIKLILAAILITGAVVACWLIKYQYDKITALEATVEARDNKIAEMEAQLKKERENNVEANKQIKKLRENKHTDTEANTWGDNRLPNSVFLLLQERYGYGK